MLIFQLRILFIAVIGDQQIRRHLLQHHQNGIDNIVLIKYQGYNPEHAENNIHQSIVQRTDVVPLIGV